MNDTKVENAVKKFLSQAGKKGGQTTKQTHPPDYYSKIGRKGLKKRWKNADSKQLDNEQ